MYIRERERVIKKIYEYMCVYHKQHIHTQRYCNMITTPTTTVIESVAAVRSSTCVL